MISEKDKAVVASMVRTGMSLNTLKRSFLNLIKESVC